MEEFGSAREERQDAAAPPTYVPRPLYHPQIYWTRPTNVVLRACQCIFTLIAFSVMADVLHDEFNDVHSFPYLLAVNVLAFLYALAQLFFSIWSLMRKGIWQAPGNAYHYFSFAGDQVMAYFLMSSGSAAAGLTTTFCPNNKYCSRLTGSITFDLLGFIAFSAASVLTGFHLVKCILKA